MLLASGAAAATVAIVVCVAADVAFVLVVLHRRQLDAKCGYPLVSKPL